MQQQYGHGHGHAASFKVLVLGDSGVGKSSLVHILCHNEPLRSNTPTVGCNIDVRLHSSNIPTTATTSTARSSSGVPSLLSRANTTSPDPFSHTHTAGAAGTDATFIEFYDVSGSPTVRHPKSRSMFYSGVSYHGLVLVYDLCSKRSYENLWKWIGEYMEASQMTSSAMANGGYQGGQYGQLNIPLLVVGTKNDVAASHTNQHTLGGAAIHGGMGLDLAEKYGGETISVCTISPAEFMPNSSTSIAFNMFFGRVMDPTNSVGVGGGTIPRPRNPSNQSGVLSSSGSGGSGFDGYSLPPPTPTPGQRLEREQDWLQYQDRAYSEDTGSSGSSSIPIMDFATFTGGAATASTAQQQNDGHYGVPPRVGSPLARSVTPTGISSGAALSTKSALRAQYERNRSVLSQYSNVGVPVYTSNNSRTQTTGASGSR